MARARWFGENTKFLVLSSVALLTVTCVGVTTSTVLDEPAPGAPAERPDPPPKPPPFIAPPEAGAVEWTMPDLEQRDPGFPYLPGEDRRVSRSIGGVVHGHLVESTRVPQPHPGLAFLDVQYQRRLIYTTDRMLGILEGAAAHLRTHHPTATLYLGNLGNPGGGDIPYSVSHNSGRDADVAFLMVDEAGESVVGEDLLRLDRHGEVEREKGVWRFDTTRNWRVVEGLIEAGGDQLQYIFVSRPLKRMLLREARRVGAPAAMRAKAEAILRQPWGSSPHNDHFHVRIYCSKVDIRSGCHDRGTRHRWYHDYATARRATVRRARRLLEDESAEVRAAAVRRLALLEDTGAWRRIVGRLEDPAAVVRAAAGRALGRLGRGAGEIAARLEAERHPQVLIEWVDALGRLGGRRATEALVGALGEARRIELPGRFETDWREFVADSLIDTEDARPVRALIDALEVENPTVRVEAARALRYLTNHRFGADWDDPLEECRPAVDAWRKWWREHRHKSREEWLAAGFRQSGLDVDRLDGAHVWGICRAIEKEDYLSFNAQRILMRLSGRQPASLSWPKHDASFYWRRWFERRRERFGAPPIPEELSTRD